MHLAQRAVHVAVRRVRRARRRPGGGAWRRRRRARHAAARERRYGVVGRPGCTGAVVGATHAGGAPAPSSVPGLRTPATAARVPRRGAAPRPPVPSSVCRRPSAATCGSCFGGGCWRVAVAFSCQEARFFRAASYHELENRPRGPRSRPRPSTATAATTAARGSAVAGASVSLPAPRRAGARVPPPQTHAARTTRPRRRSASAGTGKHRRGHRRPAAASAAPFCRATASATWFSERVSVAQNGVRGVGLSCDGVGDWFSECCLSAAQDGSPIIASLRSLASSKRTKPRDGSGRTNESAREDEASPATPKVRRRLLGT